MRFKLSAGMALAGWIVLASAASSPAVEESTFAAPQAVPSREQTLSQQLEAAENLELAGPDADASGYELTAGHLSLHFSDGKMASVRDGRGEVGLIVLGHGEARYGQENGRDRNALAYTIKALTYLRPRGGGVTCKLDRALILWSDGAEGNRPPPPPQARAAVGVVEGSAPAHSRPADSASRILLAQTLADVVEENRKIRGWDFPLRRLAFLEGARSSSVLVDMDGRARLAYLRSPGENIEKLIVVTADRGGRRQYVTAASSRIEAGPPPTSPWRLSRTHLEIAVEAPPALSVDSHLSLIPPAGRQRTVFLHLEEGRETRALQLEDPSKGFQARLVTRVGSPLIRVRSVRDAALNPLDFVHRYDTLVVRLPQSPEPGAPVELEVALDTDLARYPAGYEYFALRDPGWFPTPAGQRSRFALSWRVQSREPLRPIVPGQVLETSEKESEYLVSARMPVPVRNPIFVCGKYVLTSPEGENPPVNVWTYARPSPQAEPIGRFCAAALRFYSKRFGGYSFGKLDVVEAAPASGGEVGAGIVLVSGQSGPGIMLVAGMDPLELARLRTVKGTTDFNMAFAHEVAHQWWGQKVSWSGPEDQWLFESLAEYSAWLFVRELKGGLGEQVPVTWLGMAKRSADVASLAEAEDLLGDEIGRQHRANLIYGKGTLMLQALARACGEESFVRALGVFAKEYDGAEAGPRELLAVLNRETGRDLKGIFDTWYRETGIPDFRR